MPVAVDTRYGIRLVFEVGFLLVPQFPFHGLFLELEVAKCVFSLCFRWSLTRNSTGWSVRMPRCCLLSS
jgi:hypothetical protein